MLDCVFLKQDHLAVRQSQLWYCGVRRNFSSPKGQMEKAQQEIRTHLSELRRIYIESNPDQRLHVARQRLSNPDHGPNLLITHVSAVEGLARSVAMHLQARTKEALREVYPQYRLRSPEVLVGEIIEAKANMSPERYFGEDVWQMFLNAVKYRNLLVHECTYLGQDTTPMLISACTTVLDVIAELAGLA